MSPHERAAREAAVRAALWSRRRQWEADRARRRELRNFAVAWVTSWIAVAVIFLVSR